LSSNAWSRPNSDGYIGALPEDGFAPAVLAQIIEELPDLYRSIFKGHKFKRLAAFRYSSTGRGLRCHADNAAINVNFWVTPNEANRDKDSGGLAIWNAKPPRTWTAAKRNGDAMACEAIALQEGGAPIRIPYRYNRAVIFDSDLLHATDTFSFHDGIANSRISISLLYGSPMRK
jgi:hypothetical protein